ncbi:hypothetical protein LWI28_017412 [Acer negundo]|uniref:Uncharacterized protein n=1 Tax=Acer negundo TaxID=4023 RepID=A0AAD5P0X2_ACENE|nr:hypothetical protein LWI28_017412 [Acer negundo]
MVREGREDAMEEGDASIHQSKTRTWFIESRNSNEPASKKRLFDGDVESLRHPFLIYNSSNFLLYKETTGRLYISLQIFFSTKKLLEDFGRDCTATYSIIHRL